MVIQEVKRPKYKGGTPARICASTDHLSSYKPRPVKRMRLMILTKKAVKPPRSVKHILVTTFFLSNLFVSDQVEKKAAIIARTCEMVITIAIEVPFLRGGLKKSICALAELELQTPRF
jgi:hypothetical protein